MIRIISTALAIGAFICCNAQNVGINTSAPRFPLSFNINNGDKISLYDDGNPAEVHFGIGIASNQLLQIHSATLFDDIAFGYGNSITFTEWMRIKGNGKIGIGTNTPVARLHVADSNVLFSASAVLPPTPGSPPIEGGGRRMMWYADKAAFRAGIAFGNQWDKDSIGLISIALGNSTKAKGESSFASGWNTSALALASTAMGINSMAAGNYSTAIGVSSNASGENAVSIGTFAKSPGFSALAMGYNTTASGFYSTALGFITEASNTYATALGNQTKASGFASTSSGVFTRAKSDYSFVIGLFNDTTNTNRLFEIGNGTADNARNTAVTVLLNGNTGIGTTNPAARLHVDSSVVFTASATLPASPANPPVSGAGTRMMWYPDKAAFRAGNIDGAQWDKDSIGRYSFASGINTKAKGEASVSIGAYNNARGDNSTALGYFSTTNDNRSTAIGYVASANGFASTAIGFGPVASGNYSVSIGANTQAIGGASLSMGDNSIARGNNASSIGLYTIARSDYSFVTGKYNDTTATNRIFEIGNGTADNARNNAVTVLQNGSTLITAPSTLPVTPDNPPASGAGNRMMWYADKAAFRAGNVINTSWDKDNIGNVSFAAGSNTQASGITSTAFGNFAFATGDISTAIGNSVFAKAKMSFATGTYNDNTDSPNGTVEAAADRIFQIGNGSGNLSRSNALTILRNGNMGMAGVTNPAKPLSFPASLGEKILLYPGGAGEVGIGVYGNELRLHCDNPGSMVSFGTQDNAGVFIQAGRFQLTGGYGLYVNGNIWANGTTYASDERFKQNISPIGSPLQKLMQLNGVEYEMKADEFPKNNYQKQRQIGLIAQDVEKVIPEAVNEMDGYKGVDYARLVPLLIESIKELKKENEAQQKLIDQLLKNK
ncbi:MAG: hypothetical protein HOP10_14435 [Chitinophagaceae bacterium]|nr:hypothetical protein [Chitinophagaceae bacterium]